MILPSSAATEGGGVVGGNESATHMKDLKGNVTGGKNSENQQFA